MSTMSTPPPPPTALSQRQLASLKAIVNALLPPLENPQSSRTAAIQQFWTHDLTNDSDYLNALQSAISVKLSTTERQKLCLLLYLLSTAVGTTLVFQIPTTRPFSEWTSRPDQTAALQSLQHSSISKKREIFAGLKRLLCGLAFSYVNSNKTNPFWDAMDYPGPPPRTKSTTKPDFDNSAFVQVSTNDTTIECDVVIVGSGAGGGVAAAVMSKAGYKVVVLEKGPYVAPSQVSNLECEAFDQMYEKHSLLTTSDGNIMILAGSTLGGGTTVNWACCLELPENVREEWISTHGLTQFGTDEYDTSLQAVKQRLGCKFAKAHNTANTKLMEGCHKMKYVCEETGQNFLDTASPAAGYTCFGDAERNKQSGMVTFLADAVTDGAKLVEHAKVQQIITEIDTNGRKRAIGVVAIVNDSHRLQVNASKCVIVAAGSLNTPCILQRSGFCSSHIGRHLRLHPVTAVFGFYDEEIHAYQGAPMTTVSNEFPGAKLECPSAHTGLMAAGLPFQNVSDFKDKMLRLKHAAAIIVLQRDTVSEGRVRLGDDGFSPFVDYDLKEAEKTSMMNAVQGAVKILIASGAKEVGTGHNDDPGLQLSAKYETAADMETSDEIRDYLDAIDKRGMNKHEIGVFSAHQMGSCRMSTSHEDGVVDENGEAWECDDLFLMDASIFPTASGANPMITTLTVSHMLSTRLVKRFKYQEEKEQNAGKAEGNIWMEERSRKGDKQPRYGASAWLWIVGAGVVVSVVAVGVWKE